MIFSFFIPFFFLEFDLFIYKTLGNKIIGVLYRITSIQILRISIMNKPVLFFPLRF